MKTQKIDCNLATPEMVNKFIENYYAADVQKMEVLLNGIAAGNKAEVDVDRIVADTIAVREKLAGNISEYEDELVRMVDLATVLQGRRSTGSDDNNDEYINYLLRKNISILPDIIEIIQLLKK